MTIMDIEKIICWQGVIEYGRQLEKVDSPHCGCIDYTLFHNSNYIAREDRSRTAVGN